MWHGFAPSVPRRWLSLAVVLAASVERLGPRPPSSSSAAAADAHADTHADADPPPGEGSGGGDDGGGVGSDPTVRLRDTPSLLPLLDHGRSIHGSIPRMRELERLLLLADDDGSSRGFVPPSHRSLLLLSLGELAPNRPAAFAAVAGVVVEHSLRLWWCDVNRRGGERTARSGDYYVTLDGHGQRGRHEVVLGPYLLLPSGQSSGSGQSSESSESSGRSSGPSPPTVGAADEIGGSGERNRLIEALGGTALAVLSDLFSSPHGPNVRSAVTHGTWDDVLDAEIEAMTTAEDFDGGGEGCGPPPPPTH